jgi:hypothetical protein
VASIVDQHIHPTELIKRPPTQLSCRLTVFQVYRSHVRLPALCANLLRDRVKRRQPTPDKHYGGTVFSQQQRGLPTNTAAGTGNQYYFFSKGFHAFAAAAPLRSKTIEAASNLCLSRAERSSN